MTDIVVSPSEGLLLLVLIEMEQDGLLDVGGPETDGHYTVSAAGAQWGTAHGAGTIGGLVATYAEEHGMQLEPHRYDWVERTRELEDGARV